MKPASKKLPFMPIFCHRNSRSSCGPRWCIHCNSNLNPSNSSKKQLLLTTKTKKHKCYFKQYLWIIRTRSWPLKPRIIALPESMTLEIETWETLKSSNVNLKVSIKAILLTRNLQKTQPNNAVMKLTKQSQDYKQTKTAKSRWQFPHLTL